MEARPIKPSRFGKTWLTEAQEQRPDPIIFPLNRNTGHQVDPAAFSDDVLLALCTRRVGLREADSRDNGQE